VNRGGAFEPVHPMPGAVACTIVPKAGFAQARVTARSFRRHHPGIPFYTLLADRVDGAFDPAAEPFTLVELDRLELPDRGRRLFSHPPFALACALTPRWIAGLLDRGFRRVVFFKQETMLVGSVAPLFERLDRAPIVLTPHLTAPLEGEGALERERLILLAGSYNGGVVGVSEGATSRAFLDWWAARLDEGCRHDVASGWHFEQRWLDLVPGFFEGAVVERDPGFNCGHWSLP
jgi:hypothetical protein